MDKYYWKKTYICVTGITTKAELEGVASAFKESGYSVGDSGHVPAVGFLASYKTINGEETTNKRYPKKETLAELLEVDSRILKAVHYNTRDLTDLPKQINKATRGAYPDLIQLNVIWPDPRHVSKIKESRPRTGIILQVSSGSMKGMSVHEIANKVLCYSAIDHVLIDPSGGRGADFDIKHSAALYSAIKEVRPSISIGFAGGLCGENVEQVTNDLAKRLGTTDFSTDAEGKVRDKINDDFHGNDILNIAKVQELLKNERKVLM